MAEGHLEAPLTILIDIDLREKDIPDHRRRASSITRRSLARPRHCDHLDTEAPRRARRSGREDEAWHGRVEPVEAFGGRRPSAL